MLQRKGAFFKSSRFALWFKMSAASPQLSRDEARSLCAPSSNLNSGFLQFDTAHEGDLQLQSLYRAIHLTM